jgi:Zn-dependent M28 family amino/carboxypeptidase
MSSRLIPACFLLFTAPCLVQCSPVPMLDESRAAILGDIVAEVDQGILQQNLEELVAVHDADTPLVVLGGTCPLTHDDAREWLRAKFQSFGLSTYSHFVDDGKFSTENIIAEKKGTLRPEEIVFVGAHYDALCAAADDNSTGVAAVVEIARILKDRDFPRTLRFIGFDLEEMQLVGSTRYATTDAANDNIVAAIVFDSIGFRNDAPNSQDSLPGFPAPSQGNFIAVIGNAPSAHLSDDAWLIQDRFKMVKVVGIDSAGTSESLAAGNLMRSDHAPFWIQGKPALFITDTANFRNPNYHQPTDTISTIDPVFLKGVTQLSAALIAYWAGG